MSRSLMAIMIAAGAWVLPAAATVESVTVFPDRATVTRNLSQTLSSGQGELVLSDLPVGLMRDSLRISATGPDGLRLGAYHFETVRGSERVSERARELEQRLLELGDQRSIIQDELEARQLQLRLLRSLAEGAGQGDARLAVDAWNGALQTVGDGAQEVLSAQRQLQLDQRDLDKDIERLEKELADLGQQQRDSLALHLAYATPGAGRAEFSIEYSVSGAGWRPVYEWRLNTESGELEIIQFAEVRQRSGEDWSRAELHLSLARPATGGRLPELSPWWVDVVRPQPQRATEQARYAEAEADVVMAAPAPPLAGQAAWQSAELVGSEYTQAYRVPGQASVAANNQPHRFQLDSHDVEVRLSARSVPRHQPAAWLYAAGVWQGDLALPPGSATLYQDHTLVGQIHFPGVVPGAELASSFGVDDRISVEYELQRDDRVTEGILRKSTVLTRVHRVSVSNGHSQPIELTVLDTMPVSRDERIEVALSSAATEPDRRDVDDRPGVLAWDRSLPAGEELELSIGYRLSFPEDLPGVVGW